MPTYVYRCKNCRHEFETFQKMTDEPIRDCPKCDGEVTRLLFPVGIVFKGSGFHVNDYPDTKSMVEGNGKKKTDKAETKSESSKEPSPAPSN